MSSHKYIDRICLFGALLSLLATFLFMNGKALGVQPASQVMGYEAKLFDTSKVHTIEIIMDDWDGFLETCENEEYAPCSVVIDNEAYKNVGLRAKGNTSLSTVSQLGSDRYSFKIEFDQYDSGKTYYGLDKLCLNNLIQDNTMMKDYLTYRLMGEFGVNAPLCSYVYITVNGEDWGLYLAVEGVEDAFLQRNYGKNYGQLYKPDSLGFGGGRGNGRDFDMDEFMNRDGEDQDGGQVQEMQPPDAAPEGGGAPQEGFALGGQFPGQEDGTPPEGFDPSVMFGDGEGGGPGGGFGGMGSDDVKLQYTGDDPDSYSNIFDSSKTGVSDADQARLIQALKSLSEGDADSALDMDQVLRYFVVHNFVVNGDSYTGSMVHNYYLYEQDGRLSMLPWDYNLAFGTFQGSDASSAVNDPIDSPLSVTGDGSRPMADWIFASEEYTALYHQYFAEFIETADPAAIIEQAQALIVPYVKEDPTKFCTDEEFEAGVTALKTFCRLRTQSVSGQLAGTIPSTGERQAADGSALVDASSLTLSDMGTMNNGGGPGGGDFPGAPGHSGSPGGPSDEGDGARSEDGGWPAMADGMELPEGAPSGLGSSQSVPGGPNQAGNPAENPTGGSSAALILTGASVLVLSAALWAAARFRRRARL